jgi:UDPglucose 6-dehydrogenase
MMEAVEEVNAQQKLLLVDKVKSHFGNKLENIIFAVWGLAFKPQTDDMREAPSVVIINALLEAGAQVRAYDPVAMPEAVRVFGERKGLSFGQDEYTVLEDADAMMLITEWHQFRFPDFGKMKENLRQPVVFDGRNQFDPQHMKEAGFIYYSIGRK